MAMSRIASEFVPKVQIESVQTVIPSKVTDPREMCQVSVKDPVSSDIFRGCLNIVLCYNKAVEEDSGWLVAGWMKESLGRALQDQPMLSGRLRRVEDGGDGELEIVSNDTGVRLVEAKITVTLQEFLDLEERERAEAELVFWMDIDQQNPQFSPLLYVQVTNFQCGGYLIGISSSLLLADHLIMDNFLPRWSGIQKKLLLNNNALEKPLFYLPNLRNTSLSLSNTTSSAPSKQSGQTMIFKIAGDREIEGVKNELCKRAVSHCIQEAEHKLGSEMSSEFSLFVKESPKVKRVENSKKKELVKPNLNFRCQVITLDDLGIKELAFHDGNEPTHVSCWIGSAVAMAIPSSSENTSEVNVIVTIPAGN